jgi:hypothetical protein
MSDGPSNEVLATKLDHVRETVERLLVLAEKSATRDEVRSADEALDRRVTLLETTVSALRDANTATMSAIRLAQWVLGTAGVGGAVAFLRWVLTNPPG